MPRSRLVQPFDTFTVGRVDEGLDYGTTPGQTMRAISDGVITFVGRFGGFGNYIAERLSSGQTVYYAEHAETTVRAGQRVRAGQKIGITSSSEELGFASPRAPFLPTAHGHYREGDVTAEGRRFARFVGAAAGGGSPQTSLESLWIGAGGKPKVARIMAAVALAESGGRVGAKGGPNSDGSYDYGLWQINSSHAAFDPSRLLSDPAYNARAAVSVYNSQGLGAWATYSSGAYRQYLGRADTAVVGGVAPGTQPRTRPGGDGPDPRLAAWYSYLEPGPSDLFVPGSSLFLGKSWNPLDYFKAAEGAVTDVTSFLQWVAWLFHPRNLLRIVEFTAGLGLMAVGVWTSVKAFEGESAPVTGGARRTVIRAAEAAATDGGSEGARRLVKRTRKRKPASRSSRGESREYLEGFRQGEGLERERRRRAAAKKSDRASARRVRRRETTPAEESGGGIPF